LYILCTALLGAAGLEEVLADAFGSAFPRLGDGWVGKERCAAAQDFRFRRNTQSAPFFAEAACRQEMSSYSQTLCWQESTFVGS